MLIRRVLSGAWYGANAWCAYAIVEFTLANLVPFVRSEHSTFSPWFWGAWAAVAAALVIVGAASGAACGLLLGLFESRNASLESPALCLRVLASASLALASLVSFFRGIEGARSRYFAIAVAVSLIVAAADLLRSPARRKRFAFLTGPMTVSLLLLTAPWLRAELLVSSSAWTDVGFLGDISALGKLGVMLAALVLVATIAGLAAWRIEPSLSPWPARQSVVLLGALTAAVGLGLLFNRGAPPMPRAAGRTDPGRPNVVLISLDTVRADHLPLYGYSRNTTPNLLEFAREGVLYRRPIAASDVTLPSHASMLTGVYARWHGAHYSAESPWGSAIERVPTLAELLHARGYSTMAVVANFAYLAPMWGFSRGFDSYDWRGPEMLYEGHEKSLLRHLIRPLVEMLGRAQDLDLPIRRADELNHDVFTLLDGAAVDGRPFLLFLNYMDAHGPYLPPPPFDTRFPGKDPALSASAYREAAMAELAGRRSLTRREIEYAVSQYDGSIAFLDHHLRELFARLKAMSLWDSTLVIVTADHGEAFGDHGLADHSVSVYQDQVFVPLLIKFPGPPQPRVEPALVSHVDILPTVLDVVGIDRPAAVQGRSLKEPLPADETTVVAESYANPGFASFTDRFNRVERAMVVGDFKYVASTRGKNELYNLATDPDETHDLYRADDPRSLDMKSRLERWLTQFRRAN